MIPVLPVADQAEQLVLGSIITGLVTVDHVERELQPSDFGIEKHRRIFTRVQELHRAGEEVNAVTLYKALDQHKQADAVGGLTYITSLEGAGFLPKVDSYMRLVRDAAIRRRAVTHAHKLSALAESGAPTEEITSAATSLVADLASSKSDERHFTMLGDDRYSFDVPGVAVLEIDRLRRERHELQGELAVWRNLHGERTIDATLSIGDFNVSSVRARSDRAKLLADRARTNDSVDWSRLLEEFCQRVLAAERTGNPAVDLRELPRPVP
ncbi:MAG: hypothetical protein KJZ78_17400, partial [Bryobacteraceae bacterium]|nr:hypothetical protein [Bryobacteraceae bacterium]